MILHPFWVELRVYGKTLMMDYEEDLVSLVISTLNFNYGYWWLSDGVVSKYALYQNLQVWYDVELKKCIDYGVLGVG